jgi:hypothetical protein
VQLALGEMRVLAARLVAVSLLLVVPSAFAAELRWAAPDECAAHEFTTRLESLLGRSLAQVEDRQLRVDVERPSAKKWTLTFSWVDARGQELGRRQLDGIDCADVARAGAVAAAMALQADEVEAEEAGTVEQPAQVSEKTVDADETAPVAGAKPTSGRGADVVGVAPADEQGLWLTRAALIGDTGTLGAPVLGASVEGGVRLDQLSLGLGLVGLPTVYREASPGRGGDFFLVAGQIWGCARASSQSWVPMGCIAYEVGALSGRGAGDRVTRSWARTAFWHAMQPQLGIGLPLGLGFELDLRLGVSVAFTRPDFVLDGEVSIARPQAFSPRGAVGLRWAP